MPFRCLSCDARLDRALPSCPADGGRLVRDRRGEILADRYILQAPIGAGGTGSVVWDAVQTGIHRPVAVKILAAGDADAHARFARGAWLAARLDHEHIATIHDAGFTAQGESFLVMERLYGRPLSRRIAEGPLPIPEAARLLDQALDALTHAHARAVIHCDLKPDNLFLDDEGAPHLSVLDFGIARPPHSLTEATHRPPGVSVSDGIAGTPRYMAPEQIERGPVDGRTDLYALGVVAFELLSGAPPFPGDHPDAVLLAHLRSPPPPLPGVPAPLAAWVHRSLAKAPADRFLDAPTMRAALAVALAAPPADLPGLHIRPARRWPLLLGGALLYALGWLSAHHWG